MERSPLFSGSGNVHEDEWDTKEYGEAFLPALFFIVVVLSLSSVDLVSVSPAFFALLLMILTEREKMREKDRELLTDMVNALEE
jgi:hypothetical protein